MSHNAMGENSIEYLQYSLRRQFFKIFSIFVVNQARWKLYRQIKKAWKLEYSL